MKKTKRKSPAKEVAQFRAHLREHNPELLAAIESPRLGFTPRDSAKPPGFTPDPRSLTPGCLP